MERKKGRDARVSREDASKRKGPRIGRKAYTRPSMKETPISIYAVMFAPSATTGC